MQVICKSEAGVLQAMMTDGAVIWLMEEMSPIYLEIDLLADCYFGQNCQ